MFHAIGFSRLSLPTCEYLVSRVLKYGAVQRLSLQNEPHDMRQFSLASPGHRRFGTRSIAASASCCAICARQVFELLVRVCCAVLSHVMSSSLAPTMDGDCSGVCGSTSSHHRWVRDAYLAISGTRAAASASSWVSSISGLVCICSTSATSPHLRFQASGLQLTTLSSLGLHTPTRRYACQDSGSRVSFMLLGG